MKVMEHEMYHALAFCCSLLVFSKQPRTSFRNGRFLITADEKSGNGEFAGWTLQAEPPFNELVASVDAHAPILGMFDSARDFILAVKSEGIEELLSTSPDISDRDRELARSVDHDRHPFKFLTALAAAGLLIEVAGIDGMRIATKRLHHAINQNFVPDTGLRCDEFIDVEVLEEAVEKAGVLVADILDPAPAMSNSPTALQLKAYGEWESRHPHRQTLKGARVK